MKTKRKFKYFSIFDHEKEQEYLSEMHRHGWKFVKVTGFCIYHFEECEPEEVVYQLDYNQEGIKNKDEYVKMFNDCGWEYLQDYVGYSYFRKPADEMNDNEEIFCDDSSRLEMMRRVIRGKVLPIGVIFFCCLLPQFIDSLDDGEYIWAILSGILVAIYSGFFVRCVVKYFAYKKKTEK